MLQMSKLQKKSQSFLLKVILLAILEKQRAKNGGFFASSSLILIKRLYVCKYGHARERGKKDFWGAKRPRKGLVIVLLAVGLFLSSLRPFFCWFGLEGGNVFMNPEWGPKQVAKRCQGEGDWTLQLPHRIGILHTCVTKHDAMFRMVF